MIKKFIEWVKHFFFWRREHKSSLKNSLYDMSIVDTLNSKLVEAVTDTSNISQRIISKLENRVSEVEAQLSEREELLSDIFSIIPDVLLLKDGQGRWKLLNDAGKKVFGISGKEYKNCTEEEMIAVSPRYESMFNLCKHTDEQAWAEGKPLQIEERTVDKFGNEFIFDVTKTPIYDEYGDRKYILVHGKNVTEELSNTKHIKMLLTALNKASDSITVTDHKHNIIYANKAFLDTYGYSLQEILEKPRNIIRSGQTPIETYQDMYKSINNAEPWEGTMINKTKSGKVIRDNVVITPVLNGKPYPIYFIGINRPIERRKTTRKQDV